MKNAERLKNFIRFKYQQGYLTGHNKLCFAQDAWEGRNFRVKKSGLSQTLQQNIKKILFCLRVETRTPFFPLYVQLYNTNMELSVCSLCVHSDPAHFC